MINMDCKPFREFCEKFGDDVAAVFLETLCDLGWNSERDSDGIHISSSYQHDAANYTYSGIFTHEGVEYGFIIDNGNENGTVVREWGFAADVGEYKPPKPTIYTFVPNNDMLKEDQPGLWGVYLEWRKAAWFQEKERGYNYDRHFAPGGKTESHYRDWAASKGMKIVSRETAQEIVDRPKRDLVPVAEIAAALAKVAD